MYTAHGRSSAALYSFVLFLQFFTQQALAQGQACTTVPICAPAAGDTWVQDTVASVIWNPYMTAPFSQYDKVDIYIVGDGSDVHTIMLQEDVDLNIGVMAARLDDQLFPLDFPANRSCHLLLTKNGDDPRYADERLTSGSFFMIRNKESINGTLVPMPIPSATATISSTATSISKSIALTSSKVSSTTLTSTSSIGSAPPSTLPAPDEKPSTLSPLVIGVISAGSAALVIAILAIFLLLRTRRRFKGDADAGDFRSLHDQPSSPIDDASKSSIFKSEESQNMASKGSLMGPSFGASIAAGRSSSHTARSAEPMIKEAPSMLGYNNSQFSSSPTSPFPLLERVPESPVEMEAAERFGGEKSSRVPKGSALSAGDAHLIAETFRKSMRRPCWEDESVDEEEQDEARRAANDLLRRELSEQGLDVQRGVQRRVTIQDHIHRSSVPPPISQTLDDPEP